MPEKRKNVLGEALSAVREAIRDNETGSAHPASPSALRMQEPRNLVRAATEPLTAASARKASPSAFPTYCSGALDN